MAKKTAKKPTATKKTSGAAKKPRAAKAVSARKTPKSKAKKSAGVGAKTASKLSSKVLEKAKAILDEELRKFANRLSKMEEAIEGNIGDIADVATQQETLAVIHGIHATERDQVRQIEDALRKIKDGTYGLCERCDNPIEAARLEAIPSVKTCIACKRKEETGGFTPAQRPA